MSAGAGLLCPVRLGDAEGVTQGRYAGLQVELGRLGQVRLLSKVVEVKQRGAALHLSLHQSRRSDLQADRRRTLEMNSEGPVEVLLVLQGAIVQPRQAGRRYLVVTVAEEMVPEALCDGGADPEDLGHVLPSDQHVPVVQLHVHVRLFVQQVVGTSGWSQTDQLPEVTVQLVAPRSLRAERKSH